MKRVDVQKVQPEAYRSMFGVESYLAGSSLSLKLQALVRLRVSQINRCSYCQALHSQEAQNNGVTDLELTALAYWKGTELFDPKERAVLAMAEAMTKLTEEGVSNEIYNDVASVLLDEEIAQLIVLVATINAWNRIGIATAIRH
ncbi:carboxymuconolactone decarboxylase family protein [Neptuniibacter sp. QD37_6]|uniref:carboxymuconolactone decarboxylase family protein n=1 Tax=Neptuniibacter sp. QD37_6 TaxID=3398210 RepID=UPI0039F4E055